MECHVETAVQFGESATVTGRRNAPQFGSVSSARRRNGITYGTRTKQMSSLSGANLFNYVYNPNTNRQLSHDVQLHDPTSIWGSSETYANIKKNLASWVEDAIRARERN